MAKAKSPSAYTAGPWRITDGDNDELLIIAGSTALAEVLPYGGKRSLAYQEQRANARLMAAAPDLLEVAKDALKILSEIQCDLEDDKGEAKCICLLEEAIAKTEVDS